MYRSQWFRGALVCQTVFDGLFEHPVRIRKRSPVSPFGGATASSAIRIEERQRAREDRPQARPLPRPRIGLFRSSRTEPIKVLVLDKLCRDFGSSMRLVICCWLASDPREKLDREVVDTFGIFARS